MTTFAPLSSALPSEAPLSGATELPDQFVASFGKDAALGCFTSDGTLTLSRHDRVLLQTPRGLEIGRVLGPATIRQARLLGAHVHGELLRPLTPADDAVIDQMGQLAGAVMTASELLRNEMGLALSLIDAEAFFDLQNALLHVLHPNPDDLAAFVETVCVRTGLAVRLANLAIPTEHEEHGCGKPDCGSGEGHCTSCSTGGCATGCGTGGAAPDLRPYFAHLRDQLDARQRVPLV
jgi:hypothetical protein